MARRFIWALVICCIKTVEGEELTPCQQELWDLAYTGNVSITDSGYECQDWASQFPWRHKYTKDEMFEFDGGVKEAKNYCRNIDNPIVPWCYTKDPTKIWDFCYFPICTPHKKCGETLTAPYGRISSPDEDNDGNYENMLHCHWTIEVETSHVIEFNVPLLDLQQDHDCKADRLQIYEPQAQIGKFCQVFQSFTVTTEGNILHVEFFTDHQFVRFGFELTYEQKEAPECGGIIRRTSGIFQPLDIDRDSLYDANLNCSWYIAVGFYKYVGLVIPETDIEESEFCEKDYLQLSDYSYHPDGSIFRHLTDRVCDNVTSINVTSVNDLYIVFVSDNDGQGRGFTASFEQFQSPYDCWRGVAHKQYAGTQNVSDTGRICQPWSAQGPHEHPWSDEKLFPRDDSVIGARNYCRDPVGNGLPFCLTIDANMQFDSCIRRICEGDQDCFDTDVKMTYTGNVSTTNHGLTCEPWSDYLSGDAFPYDDKSVDKASNYCRVVAGDRIPWCFTTDPDVPWDYCNIRICREMKVHPCARDMNFNGKCVKKSYDLECGGTIEDTSGWISSPDTDGDGYYDTLSVCMWHFKSTGKTLTFLIFEYFILEYSMYCEDQDYLTIFADGTNVATYCGSQKPDMLTLPAYTTIVKFVSDSVNSYKGFNISYRIIRTDATETGLPPTATKTDLREPTSSLPRTTTKKTLSPEYTQPPKYGSGRTFPTTSSLPGTTTRQPRSPEYTLPPNYGSGRTFPTTSSLPGTTTRQPRSPEYTLPPNYGSGKSFPTTSSLPGTTTRQPRSPEYTLPPNYASGKSFPTISKTIVRITKTGSNTGATASSETSADVAMATESTTEEKIGTGSSPTPSSRGIRMKTYQTVMVWLYLSLQYI